MFNNSSPLSRFYGNNEFNRINLESTDLSRINEYAKDSDLTDNQIVAGISSQYELDGSKKDAMTFKEKKDKISEKLGKKVEPDTSVEGKKDEKGDVKEEIKNHRSNKHDGFDEDCPLCECETCKNRRYKDDSDDSGVSFQNATRMDPKTASGKVRSHESEHVRREQYKADKEGKKVIFQSVQIMTRNCPECGTVYVSGGLTRTYAKKEISGYYDVLLNNRENLEKMDERTFDVSA